MTRFPICASLVVLLAGCGAAGPTADREEVNVGYGTRPADETAGTVSRVDPDTVTAPAPYLADLLVGRVAGLRVERLPNGDARMRIRGVRSFLGSNEPLVVLDGMPLAGSGGLSFINPADVESVSVLKGADATIYGSRAANGVILITTKDGR